MARKKQIPLNRTTLFILIAVVVIIGLLVALAYSPVGQGLIDSLGETGSQVDDDGSQNNDNISQVVGLGNKIVDVQGEVLLQEISAQIHFINVGQGDSILVQFDDGTDVLIDGGNGSNLYPNSTVKENCLSYLQSKVQGNLEYVIATHPDSDHVNILNYVFDIFTIENVMYNDMDKGTTVYSNFKEKAVAEVEADHLYKIDGDGELYNDFITGVNYSFDVYAPGYATFEDGDGEYDSEEANGMSPIIVLTVADTSILLTGDATFETEEWFINTLGEETLDIDVLKVGHHGAKGSTSEAFLEKINAEYAVISSDEGEDYSHPRPELMTRLFNEGVVTYRTSRHGNIVLNVDINGDFGFSVDNEVMAENNTNFISDKMILTK